MSTNLIVGSWLGIMIFLIALVLIGWYYSTKLDD